MSSFIVVLDRAEPFGVGLVIGYFGVRKPGDNLTEV